MIKHTDNRNTSRNKHKKNYFSPGKQSTEGGVMNIISPPPRLPTKTLSTHIEIPKYPLQPKMFSTLLDFGGMAERFKASLLKSVMGESSLWDRIHLPPKDYSIHLDTLSDIS